MAIVGSVRLCDGQTAARGTECAMARGSAIWGDLGASVLEWAGGACVSVLKWEGEPTPTPTGRWVRISP